MTYPVLQLTGDFAHVEIRKGRGAAGWNDLTPVYSGEGCNGQQWQGAEGEKLAGRCCLMPDDAGSTLSQPYVVAGQNGLDAGSPQLLRFPADWG